LYIVIAFDAEESGAEFGAVAAGLLVLILAVAEKCLVALAAEPALPGGTLCCSEHLTIYPQFMIVSTRGVC